MNEVAMLRNLMIGMIVFSMMAVPAGLFCQLAPPPAGTVTKTCVCPADQIWGGTGIQVVKGQPVTITASGSWGTTPMASDCGPEGYPPPTNPNLRLQGRITQGGSTISQFDVGAMKKFEAPFDGELRFGHDKISGARWGEMTLTIVLEPAPITVSLPGKPGSPSGGGIGGPGIVNEDKAYDWWGVSETSVTLAVNTMITYEFDFKDSFDPAPYKRTFNPYTVPDILNEFKASHKFKESGIYPVSLTTTYTDVDTKSETKLYAGPFSIVAVDHSPEFIGAVIMMIRGPGNIIEKSLTDKNITVSNPASTDVIIEDVIQNSQGNKANFYIFGMFKLFAELPEGLDTGTDADRFGGVIPDSVKYRIEYGDGNASPWIPFTAVNVASPSNAADFNVSKPFLSDPFTHAYKQPGEYTMSATLAYKCVEYEPVMANGVVYTYKRKQNPPVQYTTKTRTVIVSDETPPRIPDAEIRNIYATTGDPLNIEFNTGDNHPVKELRNAWLYIEKKPKTLDFKKIRMEIENRGPSSLCGNSYRIFTDEWVMPSEFAVKKSDPSNYLKYYLNLEDGEGNINNGLTNIKEDFPPAYLDGGLNTIKYGKLFLTDNDPPDIVFTVEVRDEAVAVHSVKEEVADFRDGPGNYGKMQICDLLKGTCQLVNDHAANAYAPSNIPWTVPGAYFSEITIPEKTRLVVRVSTRDNVDGVANRISLGFKDELLVSDSGQADFSKVLSEIGNRDFFIIVEDKVNLDGKVSFRKISFPVKVIDTNVFVKTLGGK